MIQVKVVAYDAAKKKLIQDWLNLPGCSAFLSHISEMAATLSADSANLMCRNEEADKEDAEIGFESARQLRQILKMFEHINTPEYEFEGVDLSVMPVIKDLETLETKPPSSWK